jgi:flagellar biosynthesis component FlhA
MTDQTKSVEEARRELEEYQDQMSLFAKAFTPVMRLLMVYLILALVEIVPGFPGLQWAAFAWIVVRLGVQTMHPEMKQETQLQRQVSQARKANNE